MCAPWTSMEALATSDPSFDVATDAVLSTGESAGVPAVVGETTWMLNVPPGARSTGPQVRAPSVIWQEGSVEEAIDHDVPASVGRGSETVTPRAVPAPPLVTVTVKPMGSPAETVAASAALAMSMAAARTGTEAEAESDPSLVVDTDAVLETGESAAVAPVVGEVMWTCLLPPLARLPKEQVRLPAEMEHPESELGASIDQLVPA